ncbi:MAG: 3-octaprenyl-4-hydroxybenzoate carboxy-lyase [Chloroflexi bacterium B3_Chlor]|nr:MAG: 3-octaprenyl-4-hydroxybenzoate carboxy-lyase [Chloroflexi bacterium B3_Chlor]
MKKLVVGISGASAAIYGIRMLEALQQTGVESHLVITEPARKIIALETDYRVPQVEALATHVYSVDDIGAAIASGSFKTNGMVIIPCSIKTLSAVANSYNNNLLVRAADVTLKERRPLVMVVRETPLHKGHLRLMHTVSDMGAVIYLPVPAFYTKPKTIDDLVGHSVGKILDLLDIEHNLLNRWHGFPEL